MRTPLWLGALFVSVSLNIWAADPAQIERGRYLVEDVGVCHTCHTPLNEKGEYDRTKWMKGAVLNIQPINPIPKWHKTSPDLTGTGRLFSQWKDEGVINFLMTGKNPRGNPADAPMPLYKFKKEDAEAVTAYLKSLQ
jgi:hypothetical protein